MKVKYPIKPVSRVRGLKSIKYGCKLVMKDKSEFWFTLTEMNRIMEMWLSFKAQSGFRKL